MVFLAWGGFFVYICSMTAKNLSYIKRTLEPALKRYLQLFPVVGLTGPRQSGKSTLLMHCLPDYRYVTFDDPQILAWLNQDPKQFMNQHANQIIFDEAQKAPEIFNYVKMAVDRNRSHQG